jgi:hypothetical protein
VTEVFIKGMEYDDTFQTFSHCDLIVWNIYWVDEYDDTFHTFYHCDLIVWSNYWEDGVRWHLSYLCSLWPHWLKYLVRGWSTMTPFIPLLISTSLYEVFVEEMEFDDTFCHNEKRYERCHRTHPLNKYFIQWGHNEKWFERCHRTPSPQ